MAKKLTIKERAQLGRMFRMRKQGRNWDDIRSIMKMLDDEKFSQFKAAVQKAEKVLKAHL